jgi:Tol biopolymer transport system component
VYLRADGSVSPVAHSTRADHSPAISPGGENIAFVSDRSGNEEIWVVRRGSAQPKQLTVSKEGSAGSPRWSPDGRKIAYDIWAAGEARIYVMNVDGTGARRLSMEREESWMPSWSHDGRSIYFTSRRSGTREIWRMSADGGEVVQVTKNGAYEARPSTDGRTIYYTKPKGDVCCTVWSVPVGGGPEAPVAELERFAPFSRSWGTVENAIFFIPFDSSRLPVVRLFHTATRRVTDLVTFERESRWSFPAVSLTRDGRFLVYSQIDREENDLVLIENFH